MIQKAIDTPPVYYIYTLSDPRTNDVRYIGRSRNPERRLRDHKTLTDGARVQAWFSEMRSLGITARMVILFDTTDYLEVKQREREEVQNHLAQGCNLLNSQLVRK